MIERMKKITLLVSEKKKIDILSAIRNTGVVHIKHVQDPAAHEVTFIEDKLSKIEEMFEILDPFTGNKKDLPDEDECGEKEDIDAANEVIAARKDKIEMLAMIQELEDQIRWFDIWGIFDPAVLEELDDKGIGIQLYKLNKNEAKTLKKQRSWCVLKKDKEYIYIVFITVNDEQKLPFEKMMAPAESPDRLNDKAEDLRKKVKKINRDFEAKAQRINSFKKSADRLKQEKEFLSVRFGMKNEEKFSYLQGFCPEKKIKKIIKVAEKHGAGYIFEKVKDIENAPTLITNPKWIRIIDPVFKFMNTLPGYDEFDISAPFLIFFSIFFAMLIGDAGYGLLFLAFTFFSHLKFKKIPREPIFLMYLLSCGTILWGAVTGTWFGSEKIAQLPFINELVISKIGSFGEANQDLLIFICFVIGVIQLTIAHVIRAIKVINSGKALAELGWVMILWGMFFAAGKLIIGRVFPSQAHWLFIIGSVLVLFFSKKEKGVIKGTLSTLTELPLNIISSFSDIVSYLRLFAVGYASVIVAQSFNDMALAGGINSAVSAFAAAVILFFGHALNIILGGMAVVVHGVRLNMLEFSGHLGMQWSGKKYEPFRE